MALIKPNRNQLWLFPPSLDEFVPQDSLARYVADFLQILDLSEYGILEEENKPGTPAYSAEILLSVWILGYLEKIRSCRKLEYACHNNVAYLWLTGLKYPDHNTLNRFWKRNSQAIKKIFNKVLNVALNQGMVKIVLHAIDGTKIAADVSRKSVLHGDRLKRRLNYIEKAITEIITQTRKNDSDESQSKTTRELLAELKEKEGIKESILKNLKLLEEEEQEHLSTTDIDARLMKNKNVITPCYNAQIAVDENSRLIVGEKVLQDENDSHALNQVIDEVKDNLGDTADENIADKGYCVSSELAKAEANGYNVMVNIQEPTKKETVEKGFETKNFKYDKEKNELVCPIGVKLRYVSETTKHKNRKYKRFRCNSKDCPHRDKCTKNKRGRDVWIGEDFDQIQKQRSKQESEEAKATLKKRGSIVETAFAIIKENLGFRQFSVRSHDKVSIQWTFMCLVHNLKMLFPHWQKHTFSW